MTETSCVLDTQRDPRQATHGLVCTAHAFALRLWLNSIRDNWQVADLRDERRSSRAPSFGRSATRVHSPVPIDLGAIDRYTEHQADTAKLTYWARAVASSRRIAPADFPATVLGRVDLLLLHLPWILAQPAVVDFEADLRGVRQRLRRGAGQRGESVGLCRQRTTSGRCDGELLRDPAGVVRCGRDPSHIDHVQAKPKGNADE